MAETVNFIGTMLASKKGGPIEQYALAGIENKTLARAYLTTSQTINSGGGSYTTVSGYTENFDIGSNFASDKYTAPVTGYYQVNASIHFYDSEAKLTTADGAVFKNGSVAFYFGSHSTTDKSFAILVGSDVVYMTAGQYLELKGYMTTSDSSAASMYTTSTWMSVYLISKG